MNRLFFRRKGNSRNMSMPNTANNINSKVRSVISMVCVPVSVLFDSQFPGQAKVGLEGELFVVHFHQRKGM